jgi:hypothetical protein
MTYELIVRKLSHIKETSGDDESAHAQEDELYLEFIKYISTTPDVLDHVREKAALVLTSRQIEFERWCA